MREFDIGDRLLNIFKRGSIRGEIHGVEILQMIVMRHIKPQLNPKFKYSVSQIQNFLPATFILFV